MILGGDAALLAHPSLCMGGQQRRSRLRKYFIPGCVGRGLDLDLRVRPGAPAPAVPAARGDLEFCPSGVEVEKLGFRRAWLITSQKFL